MGKTLTKDMAEIGFDRLLEIILLKVPHGASTRNFSAELRLFVSRKF